MGKIYKCQNPSCSTNTYDDEVAWFKEIIQSGVCPVCGEPLIAESAEDAIWHKEAFEAFPSVLAHEYYRLYQLSCADNIFGTMLQLKDVIEATIKLLVLTVSAWARKNDIAGREEAYEKELANEKLSFGDWITIAGMIGRFFDPKKYKGLPMPESLNALLVEMPGWARNDEYDFSEWRNKTIGHGALALENDPEFNREIVENINKVTEFYKQHHLQFTAIHMMSSQLDLMGKDAARNLDAIDGECFAEIDGEHIPLKPYIIHANSGIYFYDEYANRKQQRLINYPVAKVLFQADEHFADLSRMLQQQGSMMQKSIDADVITRGEDDFLSMLGAEEKGIKPDDLISDLRKLIGSHDKGVFLLEMERGCGKSFLSQKLNSRYEGRWKLSDDIDIRTYHLTRTQYGGVQEFLDGIKSEWEHSYKRSAEAVRTKFTLEWSKEDQGKNAGYMADYLNHWQKHTLQDDSRLHKPKILLILDGLDEIREQDDEIWSFIPTSEDLNKGVYILLTGRVYDKEVLPEYYKKKRQELKLDADPIKVLAESSQNRKFLKKYIGTKNLGKLKDEEINDMIDLAHGRILELSMICSLKQAGITINSGENKTEQIVRAFLSTIEERYGEPKAPEFKMLLALLSEVSVFEPLSMHEIADLMQMGAVRLELFGMLSDISCLLAADRAFIQAGNSYHDINRYRLNNEDIVIAVREYLSTDLKSIINELLEFARKNIQSEALVACEGTMAALSHISDIVSRNSIDVFWEAADLKGMNTLIRMSMEGTEPNDGLKDLRIVNLAREIVRIGKQLDSLNKEEAIDQTIDAYQILLQIPDKGRQIQDAWDLFALADQAVYKNRVHQAYNLCRANTECAILFNNQDQACEAIEQAEKIRDTEKSERFLVAQIEAYNTFLQVEDNADIERLEAAELYDNDFEVANKAVKIADSLYKGKKDFIDIRFAKSYLLYALQLDMNGKQKEAQRYCDLCLKSFLEKEKTTGLSAQETDGLIRTYNNIGIHYIGVHDYDRAVLSQKEALKYLEKLQNRSIFFPPSIIASRYAMLMMVTQGACKKKSHIDVSVAETIFDSALAYFDSVIEDEEIVSIRTLFVLDYGDWLRDYLKPDKKAEVGRLIQCALNKQAELDAITEAGDEEEETNVSENLEDDKKGIDSLFATSDCLESWREKAETYLSCADQYVEIGQYDDAEKAYLAALAVCKEVVDEPVQDEEHIDANIDYAYALYKTARFFNRHVDDFKKRRQWVEFAEESLDIHSRLNDCSLIEGDRIVAELCCHLGQYYAETLQRDKTKALYTKALEIYKRLQIFPERVSKMQSWFQEQNRFSLRGKIHWSFVSDYSGSDAKNQKDILVICMRQGSPLPEMYFSRESLLSVVGTDNEKDFFYSLLDMINGKEIWFIFKRGGGTFVREKTMAELYAEAKAKGMTDAEAQMEVFAGSFSDFSWNTAKWARVFDELRLKGNLLETVQDKDSEWVGEFFALLLEYAKQKYPQSFRNE